MSLVVALAIVAASASLVVAHKYDKLPLTQWGTPDYNQGLDQRNWDPKKYTGTYTHIHMWYIKNQVYVNNMMAPVCMNNRLYMVATSITISRINAKRVQLV
jgi:hypothetical protein